MGAGHLAHSPEQRQRVTLEGILRVFGLAKSDFDFVIVDLGFVNAAGLERGRFSGGRQSRAAKRRRNNRQA